MKFNEFKLSKSIIEAVNSMGFEEATPVQEKAIPVILENEDLIAVAQTGTGKTAAFVLPILDKISRNKKKGTNTLIIAPTRELAMQIERQVQGFAYFSDIASIAVYGGGSGDEFSKEKQAFLSGTEIIVATPGKLLAHLRMGYVNFDNLEHLVLDEADRMLDMGFFDDINIIISKLPKNRQTLLFSATMPAEIRKLSAKIMKKPVMINIAISKPAEGVLQGVYFAYDNQKTPLINSLIRDKPSYTSIIIFCSTRKDVAKITASMRSDKYVVKAMSSDLEQKDREEVMRLFRAKKVRILIATDVISRGIDIDDINLIINYNVPGDPEDYIHRVGRTARADKTGVALTLVNEQDMSKLEQIEKLTDTKIQVLQMPKELGESPDRNSKKQKKVYRKKNPQRSEKRNFRKKK